MQDKSTPIRFSSCFLHWHHKAIDFRTQLKCVGVCITWKSTVRYRKVYIITASCFFRGILKGTGCIWKYFGKEKLIILLKIKDVEDGEALCHITMLESSRQEEKKRWEESKVTFSTNYKLWLLCGKRVQKQTGGLEECEFPSLIMCTHHFSMTSWYATEGENIREDTKELLQTELLATPGRKKWGHIIQGKKKAAKCLGYMGSLHGRNPF